MAHLARGIHLLRLLLLAVLAQGLAGCGASPVTASYTGSDEVGSFMQADFVRLYRVHVPERTELGPAAPLVLAFHGSSQTGEQLRTISGLDQAADAAGFIVVYLEAPMGAWDIFDDLDFLGLDDLGYVREVIDRVGRAHVIDRQRIIAVGLSNGGVFVQQLACKLSDRIAGFVAVAATMLRRIADECRPTRPISARYLLGTADPFFSVTGNSVLLSFEETMRFWAATNDCHGDRVRTARPDAADDGTTVYLSWYRPCDGGSFVALDSIVGGGHAWPGGAVAAPASFGPTSRDVSANEEIIRLLALLPRR